MKEKFYPKNILEEELVKAKKGDISLENFISFLLKENLFVPSLNKVEIDGSGFSPLIFDREGVQMISVFTGKDRVDKYKNYIKDVIIISSRDIIKNIPENCGIVINPGYTEGLEILEKGIFNIKKDFLS